MVRFCPKSILTKQIRGRFARWEPEDLLTELKDKGHQKKGEKIIFKEISFLLQKLLAEDP